jgi:hypothetical protein
MMSIIHERMITMGSEKTLARFMMLPLVWPVKKPPRLRTLQVR